MTRKAVVPDILITLANSVLHAKQKNCVERVALISQRINAVCALSARFIVRILKRTFVLSKINRLMFVMDASGFRNAHC